MSSNMVREIEGREESEKEKNTMMVVIVMMIGDYPNHRCHFLPLHHPIKR